ncbi:MAG: hypothetical protein ACNS62_20435 [Candidatus Cyclobacteriaceae bacterium M3_2C_046]
MASAIFIVILFWIVYDMASKTTFPGSNIEDTVETGRVISDSTSVKMDSVNSQDGESLLKP